jgi:hypothetical protein
MPVGLVVLSRVVEAYPHTGRPAYRHSLFGPSHARCPLGSLYLMGFVAHIRVPVARARGIRLHEPPQRGIIPSRLVEIEPDLAQLPLPRIPIVRPRRAAGEPRGAEGAIAQLPHRLAVGTDGDRRRAEVVGEKTLTRPSDLSGLPRLLERVGNSHVLFHAEPASLSSRWPAPLQAGIGSRAHTGRSH